MSLIVLRKCPIPDCKYSHKLVYADKFQIRNHIFRDHDYQEKLESAFNHGLIHDVSERRSPSWLAENLADLSLVESDN